MRFVVLWIYKNYLTQILKCKSTLITIHAPLAAGPDTAAVGPGKKYGVPPPPPLFKFFLSTVVRYAYICKKCFFGPNLLHIVL